MERGDRRPNGSGRHICRDRGRRRRHALVGSNVGEHRRHVWRERSHSWWKLPDSSGIRRRVRIGRRLGVTCVARRRLGEQRIRHLGDGRSHHRPLGVAEGDDRNVPLPHGIGIDHPLGHGINELAE